MGSQRTKEKITFEHIKALRKLYKYFSSQRQIGVALDLSKQTINDWFCGRSLIGTLYAMRLEKMLQGRITAFELRPDMKKILKDDLTIDID